MNKLIFNIIIMCQIALLSSSAIASKRERSDEDSHSSDETQVKIANVGQRSVTADLAGANGVLVVHNAAPAEKLDPSIHTVGGLEQFYRLDKGVRTHICGFLDGVSAKMLLHVPNRAFQQFIRDAVYARGHIKFHYIDFGLDDFETYSPLTPNVRDRENNATRLAVAALSDLKTFIGKQRDLKSVDLSLVDSNKNELIPLIVQNNPDIRSMVFYDGHEDPQVISFDAMKAIGEKCKGIRSLNFRIIEGSYMNYLLMDKPKDAFNEIENLEFDGCDFTYEGRQDHSPVLFFKHIICAFPNLRSLSMDQNKYFELEEFDGTASSPLRHLTLTGQELNAEGLIALTRCCTQLETVNLAESTGVTLAQVVQLIRALPRVREVVLPRLENIIEEMMFYPLEDGFHIGESLSGQMKFVISNDIDRTITFVNGRKCGAKHLPIAFWRAYSEAGFYHIDQLDLPLTSLMHAELLEIPDLFPYVTVLNLSGANYHQETLSAMAKKFKKEVRIIL